MHNHNDCHQPPSKQTKQQTILLTNNVHVYATTACQLIKQIQCNLHSQIFVLLSAWFFQKSMVDSKVLHVIKAKAIDKHRLIA